MQFDVNEQQEQNETVARALNSEAKLDFHRH